MTADIRPGSAFGEYVLERRLGGGGFGEVWLARDANGAMVALKVLYGQYQSAEAAKLRAEIELLAAAASARSIHIVRVLGGGGEPMPHVVMEYIEGVDLSREIANRGVLPVSEVLKVADSIADALAALQHAGIIHRDVKPANVMIDSTGTVKLTDFGIAKIVGIDTATSTSQLPMSMAYAAPETWDGNSSHLSDHYAFGALLYHCLMGRPVFAGSYAEIYRHHLSTVPDLEALPPDTPPSLRRLISECLAKDSSQRPANASMLQAAIAAAEAEFRNNYVSTRRPVREPKALGPWQILGRSVDDDWAFVCRNLSHDRQALVEVHFSDDLNYGSVLREALTANPHLVPFGAERLLGSSRLVLRPGEAWPGQPESQFIFWVAREAEPPDTPPARLSPSQLDVATSALQGLVQVAADHNLRLNLQPPNLYLRADGSVRLDRPGLPPFPSSSPKSDAEAFLRSLPVDMDVTTVVNLPYTGDSSDATMFIPIPSHEPSPTVFAPTRATPAAEQTSFAPRPVPQPFAPQHPAVSARTGVWSRYRLQILSVAAAVAIVAAVVAVLLLRDPKEGGTTTIRNEEDAALATLVNRPSGSFIIQGDEYLRTGQHDKAIAEYSQAIRANPSFVNAYVKRANAYFELDKYDEAIADYAKAIQLNPRDAEPYKQRGSIHEYEERYDLAIADYTKAIELDGRDAETFNKRGNSQYVLGKYDLAFGDYTKAIELDQTEAAYFNNRGNVHFALQRYPQAVTDFARAIQLEPEAAYYSNRGDAYHAQSRLDLALPDYNKAIELDSRYSRAYNGRGNVQYESRRYNEALSDYSRAIDLKPDDSTFYANRGLAHEALGRRDLARQDYEKAKSLAVDADEAQRAQSLINDLR